MDAICEPFVEEIIDLKSTQIGGSEALRNVIAWIIDNDPGPTLLVLPDEKTAKEVISERILPMFESCPRLATHLTRRSIDQTKYRIRLDNMTIYVAWSGSAQSLASREIRYVIYDEEDKFAKQAGDEADAISLGRERTRTYLHRRRIFHVSTPTTRQGNIWRAWSDCGDKRRYYVPCPHCDKYQIFTFPQLKWPKVEVSVENKTKVADNIYTNKQAWYECQFCKGRIEDRNKNAMLLRGLWVSEGQSVIDGEVVGPKPVSKRVGFALNCFYSPWITFSEITYKWILAKGDPVQTLNFRNSWLAEPYEDIVTKPKSSVIREKSFTAPPQNYVPSWATALVVSVDTQKDHFFYAIRAWGYSWRSQLVRIGTVRTFDEVYALLDIAFPTDSGRQVQPNVQVIDTGGRTDEVYKYALRDTGRIIPIKGSSHTMRQPWALSKLPNGVPLRIVDVDFYKDMLSRLIDDPDTTKWLPYKDVPEEYCLQMASEHKIIDRTSNKMIWVLVNSSSPNHWFDCEVYSTFAADAGNVGLIQPEIPKQKQQHQEQKSDFVSGGSDFVGTDSSWSL